MLVESIKSFLEQMLGIYVFYNNNLCSDTLKSLYIFACTAQFFVLIVNVVYHIYNAFFQKTFICTEKNLLHPPST